MNKIVEILMRRDGMTEQEANDLLNETREMIMEDASKTEDIMLMQLGLETDYIFDII